MHNSRRFFPKRFAALLLLSLSLPLSACALSAPAPEPRAYPVTVPIPTPVYCDVPALTMPALPIASLTLDSSPADTVRSYAATVIVLKSAVKERDSILKGCAAPALAPASPSIVPDTQSASFSDTLSLPAAMPKAPATSCLFCFLGLKW